MLMLHGQRYKRRAATPLMSLYEREEQRWSAPGNTGSDVRTLTGMLPWLSLLAPLRSQACPQLMPGVISPADIHSPSQVFTTTRLFLLICFSSQTDGGRAAAGPLRAGRPLKAKTFSHAARKAPLTDCTRSGPSFYTEQMWSPTCFS